MNRFGKRDRNDFFGEAYEKAKPVSLKTGKEKNYLDELDKGKVETSKVRPSAERTAPVNQDRSRERHFSDERAKDSAEPGKQPVTERTVPVSQDRSRERYSLDEPVKDVIEPRKQPVTEKVSPVNQDRSRERYSLDEPVKDVIEPRKQPVTERTAPVNQDRSRERYSLDEPVKDVIEPRRQPITERTAPVSQDRRRSGEKDEQDELFIPRRRESSTEQAPKTYAGGSSPQRSYPKELKPTVSAAPKRDDRPPARGGSGGGGQSKKGKTTKRRIPIGVAILIDVFIAILLFSSFCKIYKFWIFEPKDDADDQTPTAMVSKTAAPSPTVSLSATPTISAKPSTQPSTQASTQPSTQPSATPVASVDPNNWRAKFADKFSSDGKVHTQSTDSNWTYQSANIDVNITKHTDNGVVYFVTDIYVADIKYFKTSFGKGPDKEGTRDFVYNALKTVNGVVGINGDYYPENGGLTIRNGQYVNYQYTSSDELVMYNDGTMQAFAGKDFNYKDIKAQVPDKVYQVWAFGPMLLNSNGQPLTKFNSTLTAANNPRTALGYYEPGHYCFVTVDGRQQGYSYPGYTLAQLASLMQSLGCKLAFNLDGGGSSQLAFNGTEINKPCPDTYRKDYDILYITDQG